jgi:predicted RNase H-like HicB family nuclease
MKVKVVIHEAEEGGYWAEVPALPGCFSQGDTLEETTSNVKEAIEAYLLSAQDGPYGGKDRVLEIAV